MRYPQHLTAAEQQRSDRLDDLARTLVVLRRAVRQGPRTDVEAACHGLLARLAAAPLAADGREEIAAVVRLIRGRAACGLDDRLRKLLLPLVAAAESQLEEAVSNEQ